MAMHIAGSTSEQVSAHDGAAPPLPPAIEQAAREGRLTIAPVSSLASPDGVAIPAIDGGVLVLTTEDAIGSCDGGMSASPGTANDRGIHLQWEGAEHTYLGNNATLHFEDGDVLAARSPLHLQNGLALTYGQVVALGGDFYGIPDKPISRNGQAGFLNAYNTLGAAPAAAKEAPKLLAIMQVEIDAVNKAIREGKQPSTAYAALGDTLSEAWNRATGGGSAISPWLPQGRYLQLAATNWDHFGVHAVRAYENGHATALKYAIRAKAVADPAGKRQLLEIAYAMNAFADHFLTDLFSAGHLRTPRLELWATTTFHDLGSLCARYMHDEDSCWGLNVTNARGDSWKAYGDKRLLDSVNRRNLAICEAALQASVDEVYAAYQSGSMPATFEALAMIPDLGKLTDPANRANSSPLFTWRDGTVQRRNDLLDRHDYSWSRWWTAPTTLEQLYVLPQFRTCMNPET